ncbi:MAG: DUF2442 domain-containing protein [Nevskiaceae bacterium]|jgi:hypothetical protein|nr:DUF2442 domain-containing protein [Nevskiaceae bacterium]
MDISEHDFQQADAKAKATRAAGHAVSARYDALEGRIAVALNTGVHITFPVELAEGLAGATAADLADIQITPAGTGLHWPRLDADLYIPALLQGVFGSKRWMARQLGAAGGAARSEAKKAAARVNGSKGGRPRKRALAQVTQPPRAGAGPVSRRSAATLPATR